MRYVNTKTNIQKITLSIDNKKGGKIPPFLFFHINTQISNLCTACKSFLEKNQMHLLNTQLHY